VSRVLDPVDGRGAHSPVAALSKIDLDRVYLTGISMGGYGAWTTAINFPEWFAARDPGPAERDGLDAAGLPRRA
jgi:poly(3-hydroxybutyrate) depolymerase